MELIGANGIAVLAAACESGDINLAPTTVDNSTGGGSAPATPNSICASYTSGGQTFTGEIDTNNES